MKTAVFRHRRFASPHPQCGGPFYIFLGAPENFSTSSTATTAGRDEFRRPLRRPERNDDDKTIATIPKNQREEIRVALSEFTKDGTTYDMVSARVHYDAGNGEMKPGRNGLTVPVRLLPDLIEALEKAERQARAAGLIEDELVE